jgi:hypothetical protein
MSNRRSNSSPVSFFGTGLLLTSLLSLSAFTGACSSGDSGNDDSAGGSGQGGGSGVGGINTDPGGAGGNGGASNPGVTVEPVGTVVVTLVAEKDGTPARTTFQGFVRDAPVNQTSIWDVVEDAGGCQTLVPRVPFCETPCGADADCVEENVCRTKAKSHSVGTMTVKGIVTATGATEFTIESEAPKFNYDPAGDPSLGYPPAAEGADISVSTSGGDYAPFEVKSSGIAPIAGAPSAALAFEHGKGLPLTWTAKGSSGKSRMEILVNIAHHGGEKGKIVCDVEDNGSFEIPSSMVDRLLNLGVAGFPTVKLSRVARGSTDISVGRIALEVVNHVEIPLEIPGVISCANNSECPDGQSCSSTRKCE